MIPPFLMRYGSSDAIAPAVPTGLTVLSRDTPTQLTLDWNNNTDGDFKNYRVYRDAVLYASPTTSTQVVTGLTQNTSYAFTVSAVDFKGNESAVSSAVNSKAWTPYVDLDNQYLILDTVSGHYTTDTGGVDAWLDQTVSDFDCVQTSSANRPGVVSDGGYDAVQFVGANGDRLRFTGKGASMFATPTTAFSVSVFMKFSTTTGTPRIFEWGETAGASKIIVLQTGGSLHLYTSGDGTALVTRSFTMGTPTAWHHYMFTYSAGTIVAYQDGVSQSLVGGGTVPVSLYTGGSQDPQLSAIPGSGTEPYNGFMDNLVMTSDVFTSTERTNLGLWRPHA